MRTVTYGIEDKKAHYRAERIWRAKVHSNFDLVVRGKKIDRFTTQLFGTHNVLNVLAAIAACHEAGVDLQAAIDRLREQRLSRTIDEIRSELDTALSKATALDQALKCRSLVQMSYGQRSVFDPRTHTRRSVLVARLS